MRASTIVVAGAALGLAASVCWAQAPSRPAALASPTQEQALSAQLAQAAPAPRAHQRQAVLVGGLRVGATHDPLARDVPPALERAGFAIHNSRNDPAAIIAAIRRLTAAGVPAGDIIVLARGAHSAAALEAAATLALPALNLVLIDGCPSLIARGQTLPPAHILAIATSRMAVAEPCGQAPEAGEGRPTLEFVRLTQTPAQRGGERTEPDALARAIAGWISPPQFPDDAN